VTIRVVLFDLWGTLIADDPQTGAVRNSLRAQMTADALASLGLRHARADIEAAFDRAAEAHSRIHDEGLDITAEGRTILYLRHLDEHLPDRLDEPAWTLLHRAILTPALHARPQPLAGAAEALAQVKAAGFPVGLVSNAGTTPGFVLREILDGHGLLRYFDDTVFSDEVELAKPNAAIFERALDAFGLAPEQAVFVGDQPVLDVLGPRAAGLWAVQVGHLGEDGIEPHVRIASVADVMSGIEALERA